jgi:hypothetical protein
MKHSNGRIIAAILIANASFCLAADTVWKVRPDGIGPIKVGMSLAALNRKLHASFEPPKDADELACYYVEPTGYPGLGVMLLDGHVARVDVDGSSISTTDGIRNGVSESHVRAVYGKALKVSPNEYDPEERYLTFMSPDGQYGIRFETDHGEVARYYAGQAKAIAFVEGCS